MPVSGQLSRTTGGGPAIPSWFPVAFRPPAFASWSSCARQGAGPSLRSAYRSLLPGPDPDGVATFRAHELRPGWVPSLPRGLRCPHGRQVIPGRRLPPCSGRPCTPVQQPTTGGFLSRGIIKGSRSFTRPAFPWPVAPGWSGSPRASSPGFTPRRYRRRMPGWGQASWALA